LYVFNGFNIFLVTFALLHTFVLGTLIEISPVKQSVIEKIAVQYITHITRKKVNA